MGLAIWEAWVRPPLSLWQVLVAWVMVPAVASHGKILATGERYHHIPRMAIGCAGQVLQHIALDVILGQRPAGGLQVYAPGQVPTCTKGGTDALDGTNNAVCCCMT